MVQQEAYIMSILGNWALRIGAVNPIMNTFTKIRRMNIAFPSRLSKTKLRNLTIQ